MTKRLTPFSLHDIQPDAMHQHLEEFTKTADYAVAKGLRIESNPYIKPGEMFLMREARLAFVRSGEAVIEVNLTDYIISQGMIVLLPHDTIVNVKSISDDYLLNGTVLMPGISVEEVVLLRPDEDDYDDLVRIYDTLCHFCLRHKARKHVIELLQRALVEDIRSIEKVRLTEGHVPSPLSRGEEIFRRFKTLVSHNARTERKVAFYADKLCVSPHYLMAVIQRVSGQSVMQWVERAALLQAKVLLSTSDQSLSSLSAEMNFPTTTAFCRWFKRIEGVTPGEYLAALAK